MPLSEPGGGAFNEDSINRIYSDNAGVPSVDNVFYVGTDAGLNNVGGDVIAIGSGALDAGNVADGVIALGRNAGGAFDSGEAGAIFIGDNAGAAIQNMRTSANDGAGNIVIGKDAMALYEGSSFYRSTVVIGHEAFGRLNGTGALQQTVAIGWRAGWNTQLSGGINSNCVFIGSRVAGDRATANGQGNGNVGIGDRAMSWLNGGVNNTCIGTSAGEELQTGNRNVLIGIQAGERAGSADSRTIVGSGAGTGAGDDNVIIGDTAGVGVNTTDINSIIIGTGAVTSAISGSWGNNNIVIGTRAADYSATPSPMQNTFLVEYGLGGTNVPFLYGEMDNANLMIGGSVDGTGNPDQRNFNGGVNGCLKLQDVTTAPTLAVGAGGIIFVDAGALKFLGGAGTVTTIAPA